MAIPVVVQKKKIKVTSREADPYHPYFVDGPWVKAKFEPSYKTLKAINRGTFPPNLVWSEQQQDWVERELKDKEDWLL